MKEKTLLFGRIIIYNVIAWLPSSDDYLNKYFVSNHYDAFFDESSSRYIKIINFSNYQYGLAGLLIANIALLIFILPISIYADIILSNTNLLSMSVIINIVLALLISIKFNVLNIKEKKSMVKMFYIMISL